jgi:hypothetical protein
MIELSALRPHLLRKVLPFALTLALGSALGLAPRLFRGDCAAHPSTLQRAATRLGLREECSERREAEGDARAFPAKVSAAPVAASAPARELPELRVLSPMLMEEVRVFQSGGGTYETPRILAPEGAHYAAPERKAYRQGVLQLNFLFGADGSISQITPLVKRHDCGICTQGANVVGIDPRESRWTEQVEAAKEAVGRIRFVPGTHDGRPAGMHGLAECVFKLD